MDGGVAARVRAPWFAVVLGVAFVALVLLSRNEADVDLWARMAVGRLVEATGDVPRVDPFAFTPKKEEWIDHEWLSGVVFDGVVERHGAPGLLWLKLALAAATVALLIAARVSRSAVRATRLAVLLPALAWSSFAWGTTVRSHVFTLVFVALFAWALSRYERGGRAWWLVPLAPVAWVWAQLHGGVLVGLGLLAVWTVWTAVRQRERLRPLAVVAALAAAGLVVGPYGPEYGRFLFDAVTMDRPGIVEWEPLSLFSGAAVVPGLFVLSLVVGTCVDGKARRAAGPGLWLLAIAAVLAFRHHRHVPLFLMMAYVFGADVIAVPFERATRAARRSWGLVATGAAHATQAAALLLLVLVATSWGRTAEPPDVSWYPVDACRWLRRSGPGGRLLVGFNEGSFALWRLYPRYLVSLDGRYEEVYPASTKRLVYDALHPEVDGHAAALAAVAPDAILLRRARVESAAFGGAWAVAYRDERFDVLVREPPERVARAVDLGDEDADVWAPLGWR